MRPMLLLTTLAVVGLLGCSDGGGKLYILPFPAVGGQALTVLPLQVGQSHTLKLKLSGNVSELTYVDVDAQQYADMVFVDPLVFKFKEGEGAAGDDVTIKGQKATPSGGVPIKFMLRGSSESRSLTVKVTDQIIPDAGPMPDQGPTPDQGPSPDTSTADQGTSDVAVSPDA